MAAMIVVNSKGSDDYQIWPLAESEWNGLTTADCIFPSFLFIMGLAIPLALKPDDRHKKEVWLKIFKRFAILFLIGVALNFQDKIPEIFQETPFTGFRIPGVFQRISICYLVISAHYLLFSKFYFHFIPIVGCLAVYLGFMYGYPVPPYPIYPDVPCGRGNTSEYCYFGAYLDLKVFGPKYMMLP